jgi:hypothetical protein
MKWPFVWRKTADSEKAGLKTQITRQRKGADRAERELVTEKFDRRLIARMYVDLLDEHEAAMGPLLAAPTPAGEERREGLDKEMARRRADRIAELMAAKTARASEHVTAAPAASEGDS